MPFGIQLCGRSGGDPHPPEFSCLMFPRAADVMLFDRNGARILGRLDRAILVEDGDTDGSRFIRVPHDGGQALVPIDGLAYLVDDPPRSALVQRWRQQQPATGGEPGVVFRPGRDGWTEVTVTTVRVDGARDNYRYRTRGAEMIPIGWTRWSDKGAAFRLVEAVILSGGIGLILFAAAWIVLRLAGSP